MKILKSNLLKEAMKIISEAGRKDIRQQERRPFKEYEKRALTPDSDLKLNTTQKQINPIFEEAKEILKFIMTGIESEDFDIKKASKDARKLAFIIMKKHKKDGSGIVSKTGVRPNWIKQTLQNN